MDLGNADLTGLLSAAPLAMGVTRGPEHMVVLLNPAARSLLCIPHAGGMAGIGRPLRTAAPGLTDCGLFELLDRVYATGVSLCEPQQQVVLCHDGHRTERIVNFSCHPRYDRDEVIGLQWYGLDLTDQVHATRRLEFLVKSGPALLETSLEHRDAPLNQAAHLAVRALGELCVINLKQSDGSLVRAAVVHADPEIAVLAEQLKPLLPLPGSPPYQVLDSGKPMLLQLRDSDPWAVVSRGRRDLWDRLGLESGLIVPLTARGRILGTFSVCSTTPNRYTDDDIALAEGMALRAALALDTAVLYDSERRAREQADRAVAGTAGLLRATAALSGAVSTTAIAAVVGAQGAELLGAQGAALFVRGPDGLRLVYATGWPPDIQRQGQLVRLTERTPLTYTVLAGVPLWLESHQDLLARYPRSAALHRGCGYEAIACLPLIVEDTVLGAIAFSFTTSRQFGPDDRTLLLTLAEQCAQALDRARLYAAEQEARAAAERQRDRIAALAEASLVLNAPQSQKQRLQRLTRLVVPRIADWCAVHLVHEDQVEQIAYAHQDPDTTAVVERLAKRRPARENDVPSGVAQVIRTGMAELFREISDADLASIATDAADLQLLRTCGVGSAMIVPLAVRACTVGSITLIAAESGQRFGAADLAFAQDLATRAALALDNARLYEKQRDIAVILQEALLPQEFPTLPGVEVIGRYVAAGETNQLGGDLYDVFCFCGPDSCCTTDPWSLLIGDVCGKGVAAAALTALIRYTVRAEAGHLLSPRDVLRRLNQAILSQRTPFDARFCTAIYGQVTPAEQGLHVKMACAGHIAHRVLRHDGTVEVGTGGGTILGVYAEPALACGSTDLRPGDTLLLVTDGVTEARGFHGFYGDERLDALLAGCTERSAGSIADLIIEDVLEFQAGMPRDDVAVLVVQVAGVVPERARVLELHQ